MEEMMDMTITGCQLVAVIRRGTTEYKLFRDPVEQEYIVRRYDIPSGDLLVEDEDLDRKLYYEAFDDTTAVKLIAEYAELEAVIFP